MPQRHGLLRAARRWIVRARASFLLLGLGAALSASLGAAQDTYPARPITLIVSLAAGTGMDVVARTYAEKLSLTLAKPVVVDNRPGAATVIAASAVASAPADGYTYLVATSGTVAINPHLFKSIPYDPVRDFVPVSLYLKSAFVLVVNPALPIHSMADLIRYAQERPLSFSSSGTGNAPHLVAEFINQRFGLRMTHVPYKSGPQAINDVAAGHVQLSVSEAGAAMPLIQSGQLRAIAVSSATRVPSLPDVPSMAEATSSDIEAVSWHALLARRGTPEDIVLRMHEEMARAVASTDVQQRISAAGLLPMHPLSVREIERYIAAESERWGALVKSLGLERSH